MKRRTILICMTTVFLVLLAVGFIIFRYNDNKGNHADQKDYTYRKIAWEALDKDRKQYVSGNWQTAQVVHYTMDKDNSFGILPLDKSSGSGVIYIKGKEVVIVSFGTGNSISGDVIVYIDAKTNKAIGVAPFM